MQLNKILIAWRLDQPSQSTAGHRHPWLAHIFLTLLIVTGSFLAAGQRAAATAPSSANYTPSNTAALQTGGAGAALDFDGVDDSVVIPNSASLNSYATTGQLTIEFWIKPVINATAATFISKRVAENNNGFVIQPDTNSLSTYHWLHTSAGWQGVQFTYDANRWQHIALVAQVNGALKLYQDGVEKASTDLSGVTSFTPNSANLGLMFDIPDNSRFAKGQLDEVRIWQRALSQSEIQASMNCEVGSGQTGLVAHYSFNQGVPLADNSAVTTLTDSSDSNNNGTLTNFALTGSTSTWVEPGGVTSGVVCVDSPEINVQGKGVTIVSGDDKPDSADATDFGSAAVAGGTVVRTFTIQNMGSAALTLNGDTPVTVGGTNASDFTVTQPAGSVAAGGNTTFQITFDPSGDGLRTAKVSIANDDSDENPYTFVVQGQGAPPGVALDFDGLDDYVTLPTTLNSGLGSNEITVEGWFYPTGNGAGVPGWVSEDYYGDGSVTFTLVQIDSTVQCGFFIANGEWQRAGGVPLNLNAWQHIACTYDQQAIKLYHNGVLAATLPATAALPASGSDWYLGERWDVGSPYAGRMDEVRIWNRALSASAIQASMNCEVGSGQTGLVAHYSFNQGVPLADNSAVTTLTDSSDSNNTGTLTNFALTGSTSNWVEPGGDSSGVVCVDSPEINVQGKGVTIVSGDDTPDSADATDFGNVVVPGGTVVRTFTIQNTGSAALTLNGVTPVTVDGDHAADFTVTQPAVSSVAVAGSTTFQVTFTPGAAGVRTATVSIASNDSDEGPYTFAIQGTGSVPNAKLNGTPCDLIDAIDAANADADVGTCPAGSSTGTDTITLLSDVALSAVNNLGTNGLPVIRSPITLDGTGYTISRAVNSPAFRFFQVEADGALTLNAVTLQNGNTQSRFNSNGGYGGAITNYGTLTVNNSTLTDNSAIYDGGAIYNAAGTVTLNNSTLANNTSGELAGAIYNLGTVTLDNSTLVNNSSTYDAGAIDNQSTMIVHNSTLSGNTAGDWGGAIRNSGSIIVTASTFTGNHATNQGGAIRNSGTLTLQRNLISGNIALEGSELYQSSGTVTSQFNLWGDSSKTKAEAFANFTPSGTDITAISNGTRTTALAAILNSTLADNGGPTLTHALVVCSPAVDAAGNSDPGTDQRGVSRPQGAANDIGAFEFELDNFPCPEIDVQGNGVSIANNDNTPDLADHTDFGSVAVGGTVVRTFTIQNTGNAKLNLQEPGLLQAAQATEAIVTISGDHASDFTVTQEPSSPIAAGSSTTFQITFTPGAAGLRTAKVSIPNTDRDEGPYTFAIQGAGGKELAPNSQLVQAANPKQLCLGAAGGYVRNCTLTYTLRNTTTGPLMIGHYRVNSISAHADVLNGTQSPGQGGTLVMDPRTVTAGDTFQPKFTLGLTLNKGYSINISVFGYAGSVMAAGADPAQAIELGEFEVTLEPDETSNSFRILLPIVQR